MSDLTQIKTDEILKPFFDRNPNFDLLNFNFFDENAVEALNWEGLDKEEICDRLKAYQQQLTSQHQCVDASGEAEQDQTEEVKIEEQGEEIVPIEVAFSAVVETPVLETKMPVFSASSPEDRRSATQKIAGPMVLLANAMQFSSPRLENTLYDNTSKVRQNFESLPSYQKLFGSLDYVQCDPCQSIFSPSAYFVDLMQIVDQRITQVNNIPKNKSLSDRRPDLEKIPLTCDNTNDTVPYTQIVSEVLAEKLKKDIGEDVFQHLATEAKYPHNLPSNLYLEQIRLYLGHLNANPATIYQTFHPQDPYSTIWAREYLGLSLEEYNLITVANAETKSLSDRYGFITPPNDLVAELSNKETFLKQTGLSWQELNDLIYQNLSEEEKKQGTIRHEFYINKKLAENKYIDLDAGEIKNLTPEVLDRCDRFLRLARKIGWSFADLDWVLTSINAEDINETAIQKIAKIKLLQAQTKLPLDVLCSFWYNMKAIAKGDKQNRPQDLFDRVFNNPLILHEQEKYEPNSALVWKIGIDADKDKDEDKESSRLIRSHLLAALQLSDRELTDIVEGIWEKQTKIELNLANLSRLFRISQILKLLELKVNEYKLLLKFINKSFESLEKLEIDKLIEIREFSEFVKASGFSVYELDYILNGTVHPSVEVFLPEENMAAFMESLWKKVQLTKIQLSDIEWHLSLEDRKLIATPDAGTESLNKRYNRTDVSQNLGGLNQKEIFLKQTNLYEQELKDLLYQNLSPEEVKSGKTHQFYINKKLPDKQYLNLNDRGEIQNLDLETLDRIDRFLRLARKLGWSFADLDWVLTFINAEDINEAALKQISKIKKFQEQNKLPLAVIRSVYNNSKSQIKTIGIEDLLIKTIENQFYQQGAIHFGMELGLFSVLVKLRAQSTNDKQDYLQIIKLLFTKEQIDGNKWREIVECLKFISRMHLLVSKLNLTETDLRSISDRPQTYNINSLTKLTVKNIQNLYKCKNQLLRLFSNSEKDLVKYFEVYCVEKPAKLTNSENKEEIEKKAIGELAKLTSWQEEQIDRAIKFLTVQELYNSVEGLLKLKQCFDLCATLGCNIDFLCDLSELLKNGSVANNWEKYQKVACSAISLAKAKYDSEEWAKVFGKLNDTLEERKCKILTDFALQKLGMENLRQLSEYLLLDVEMTSCACNSRIQLAILSVQTYLQRCHIGIESEVKQVNIPPVWWEWIMNYRKWEANRKVFLYPENYIDPSLRKNASPIFKELQDELLQSEITAEAVEAAYRNYFDKFAELARLQIVDSCRYSVQTPKSPEPIDTLFIFAKTITQPHTFYYRRCEQPEAQNPSWGYWEKIDLQINSEYLAPVYAFNRLFVFWVETKEIKKPENDLIRQATIKYSFLNASQKWVSPHTLVADMEILSQSEISISKVLWQRVYPSVLGTSEPEKILVSFGGFPALPPMQFDKQAFSVFPTRTIAGDFLLSDIPLSKEKPKEEQKLELSRGRNKLAATTIGNLAVFAGGYDGSFCNTVDVFEYKDGHLVHKKEQKLELSRGRNKLAATTIGNLAVFAGGYDGSFCNTVDVFEYKDGKLVFKETLNLSTGRHELAATTIGNLAVFAGGDDGSSCCNTVDVFEYKDGRLVHKEEQKLELSKRRTNLAATTIGNLAIFAGGYAKENGKDLWYNNVDIFEYKDGRLVHKKEQKLELSRGRSNLAATTIRNLAVFAGGYDGSFCNTVDVFEYKDGKLVFKETLNLSTGRNNLVVTTIGNLAIFAGGYDGSFCNTVDVFEYKDGCLVRKEEHKEEQKLKLSRGCHELAATTIGNLSVFAGGYTNENKQNPYCKIMDVFYISMSTFGSLRSDIQDINDITVIPIKTEPNTSTENQNQSFILQRRNEAFLALFKKDQQKSSITRLTTNTIQQFSHTLFAKGLDGLLSVESQQITEPIFPSVSKNNLDFDGAYGAYFWEIFFHIPFLIASTLNAHQRYHEARQWYQYIFNPIIPGNEKDKDRFWRFLPFRGYTPEKLKEILTNEAAIQAYKENPFDPHAIARLRIGAYEKAVVMKYIDNLLNWGDALFTQDNWESITQATTLYLLAYDLLGSKPKNVGKPPTPKPKTFADIKAGASGKIAEFLIDLGKHPEYQEFLKQFGAAVPFNALDAYFCVSENQQFGQYWDRVEDRLFKIRHCQNIKGIERQLALFQAPLDPMQLVRQAAADGAITLSIADTVPHYRFSHLLERAKGMASTVIQLGSTLLNTLEKKDAEELALLRATQEPVLLKLISKTKEKQIEEAEANRESLEKSLEAAKYRGQYYQNLIAGRPNIGELTVGELSVNFAGLFSGGLVNGVLKAMELATLSNLGLNAREAATINLFQAALDSQIAATGIRGAAAAAYLIPNIFGTANGGMQFGDAVNMGAGINDGMAGIFNQSASLASTVAQFQRRKEDWEFQQKIAEWDVKQIEDQIKAAKVREDMAKAELEVHNKSIKQSEQVEQFFKDKFTNKELYQWMVGRLSSLYFQTYKIALEMAYSAQKAYQYELNKDDIYLQPTYWDSYKKGLLAGESLMLGLNQLEKAYLDGSDRRFEIEKIISLRQLDPQALILLKTTGTCQFSFDEKLFALDFPSHYCRQIKTISVSIPAVVGPYQNINATLTQTSNKVLIKPDANAVKWLLTVEGNPPDQETLRQGWRNNQQIAISKGVNDNGLFVLNFQDERYLPFEGTGAISNWTLEMPKATNQIDFDSITDVIITLNYTALQGRSTIRDAVAKTLTKFTGQLALNLRRELLQKLNSKELSFSLSPNLFRGNLKNYHVFASTEQGSSIYLELLLSNFEKLPRTLELHISDENENNKLNIIQNNKKNEKEKIEYTLKQEQKQNELSSDKEVIVYAEYDLKKCKKIDITLKQKQNWLLSVSESFDLNKVRDITLVIPYEGEIDWSKTRP